MGDDRTVMKLDRQRLAGGDLARGSERLHRLRANEREAAPQYGAVRERVEELRMTRDLAAALIDKTARAALGLAREAKEALAVIDDALQHRPQRQAGGIALKSGAVELGIGSQ